MTRPKEFYRSVPKVDYSIADAVKADVIYKYFENTGPASGKILTEENVGVEIIEKNNPTVLLMHGWTTDDTSPWYGPLRDEYFKLGPHNIIFLNWSKAGNKSYDQSSANVKPVGKFIAEFLVASGVPPQKIHLIGHSLGSQLSGFIGKAFFLLTGKKIGRITALDPAGPKFNLPNMRAEERLDENDAEFVDVIHTDIQYSGVTEPVGHVDFYPNEGKHQPGCPERSLDSNCSHAKSTLYFIESLRTKTTAKEGNFTEVNYEVTVTVKKNGKQVIFGQHVDTSARGVYYFETNPEQPFLK